MAVLQVPRLGFIIIKFKNTKNMKISMDPPEKNFENHHYVYDIYIYYLIMYDFQGYHGAKNL